ncbi:HupE/UreJ family protein [Aquincola sp. J276]|uniref:HupE/UreJ family protein n=1 Tax=Aquincola sp. J276 TaxID=2898432 RepID=UPI0021515B2C|nr:HupE/UreJ family protein [Aquincola sp. J276]MCR5865084.1 HupE/UreJ family protein [Aquincola sp. J276]
MRSLERLRALPGLLLLWLALAGSALAHQSSDAYLVFQASPQGGTELRWDVALRDLDAALPALDADGDRRLTWGEVRQAWPAITAHVLPRLQVAGCDWQPVAGPLLERRADGAYAVLQFTAPCSVAAEAPMSYTLLAEVDPTHRGIAKLVAADGRTTPRLLDPTAAPHQAAPASFLAEGVHHIVTGYDHLLFLLCLILPAVLRRTPGQAPGWAPVAHWREAALPVVGVVTLFTLAHSITLALAALGLVSLPGWFVEPAIAVTIAIAAIDNLRPLFGRRRGLVTFVFGLVHGFGFAGVLGELDLPAAEFGWALLRFNLGLELGQLAIVAAVVPLLYLLRRAALYVPAVLRGGSAAAIGVAAWWLVQRTALA